MIELNFMMRSKYVFINIHSDSKRRNNMKKVFALMIVLISSSIVCLGQPVGIFTDQASVGDDDGAGYVTFANDAYEIEGCGNDIWDVPDGFFWVYKEITGDFTVTATVEWLTEVNDGDTWKKAGIIARNTVDDPFRTDGEYACSALIKGNFSNFFVRPLPDEGEDDAVDGSGEDISAYTITIQLKRVGDVFSMHRGLVAGGFEELGSIEIDMLDTVVVGLCVTSHNTSTIEIANFTDVSIDLITTSILDFELYE
jgi:TolB protein